jgi:hypothetical protein
MPMIHPVTGATLISYCKIMKDPATAEIWMAVFGKDFGKMSQGDNKTGQKGTIVMLIMSPSDIPQIPKDCVITYARVVVNHRSQKEDPNCIRITAWNNLINYPGKLTTKMADITTAKLHWNSMLSTPNAKFMCLDIKKYLSAPFDRCKYMQIAFTRFPPWIVEQYDLTNKVDNGHIFVKMQRAVWGLLKAGILANKLLRKHLAPHRYFKCNHMPGMWKYATGPILFTLIVDHFGVKYSCQEDIEHLIKCIKK